MPHAQCSYGRLKCRRRPSERYATPLRCCAPGWSASPTPAAPLPYSRCAQPRAGRRGRSCRMPVNTRKLPLHTVSCIFSPCPGQLALPHVTPLSPRAPSCKPVPRSRRRCQRTRLSPHGSVGPRGAGAREAAAGTQPAAATASAVHGQSAWRSDLQQHPTGHGWRPWRYGCRRCQERNTSERHSCCHRCCCHDCPICGCCR